MIPPERHEGKYVVRASQLPALREDLAVACRLDEHSQVASANRYSIATLYLDGPGLPLYRAKLERLPTRFKLRLRVYPGHEAETVFVEVKRRVGDRIRKTRARLPRAFVEAAVASERFSLVETAPVGLGGDDARVWADFAALATRVGARPVAWTLYEREAWVGLDEAYARVTFDLALRHAPARAMGLSNAGKASGFGDDSLADPDVGETYALVELKFEHRAPWWMANLVQRHELVRRGFSKYGAAVEGLLLANARRRRARTPRW